MQLLARPWDGLPAELADGLRRHRESIVDDVVESVGQQVPEYGPGGWDEAIARDALERLAVVTHRVLGEFADVIGRPDAPTHDQDESYRALGRGTHARGLSIDAMTRVSRVIARVAAQWVQRIGADAALPVAVVLQAAEATHVFLDEGALRMTEGYNEATASAAGERHARRSELLDALLAFTTFEPEVVQQAARAAGWPLPAALAAVALGDEERPLELARAIGPEVLAGSRAGRPCLFVPDPEGPGRAAHVAHVLAGHEAAIGPSVAPADAKRSFELARGALALANDAPLPRYAEHHLTDLLLTGDSVLLDALIDRHLAPIAHLAPAKRRRLADTLLAWLEHHGSAPAAGAALHTHAGTVRYRLAQLREHYGEALDDPATRFELQLALRADRLRRDARRGA